MKRTRLLPLAAIFFCCIVTGCKQNPQTPSTAVHEKREVILYEKNFSGVYLDENNEPNLKIVKHSQGDMYHIEIGIYRLTNLDDGKGRADFDVLEFVATDANGNPIEGEITFRNDTAEVTFTHSTWPLLKNGSKFHYVRQREAKADKEKTYLNAVEEYLTDEIRRHYTDGDICIPFYTIIDVDDSNRDDIKVKGDFWVLNYNLVGDTLKCVSGGNYPGQMHIRQSGDCFTVIAFDEVEDGSRFISSAKRIFANKYAKWKKVYSDEKSREKVRAASVAEYVKRHNLKATMYQGYGSKAVRI